MRYVLWLLLLFTVAVVAAVTLGRNDGVVAIAWRGWRVDLSLNLFLLALAASCLTFVAALQALDSVISLPERARRWRVMRRDQAAQASLREALAEHFAARYRRAQRAAQRSAAILDDTPELDADGRGRMLAHLLSAASAHKLQDRESRDRHVAQLERLQQGPVTAAHEGAKLLRVEWALDDRDAAQALRLIDSLPAGAARRTQALRLKLQAQRLERTPLAALPTARLLAKHQAFAPHAAQGLIRSLAIDALEAARDVDQLQAAWNLLDAHERADAFVAARGAKLAAARGRADIARTWLAPLWDGLEQLGADAREAVAIALTHAAEGAEPTWLVRVEEAAKTHAQDAAIAAAAGAVFADRRLWGKAARALEQAARSDQLDVGDRRRAWQALAELARHQGDETGASAHERQATALADE